MDGWMDGWQTFPQEAAVKPEKVYFRCNVIVYLFGKQVRW